MIPPLTRKFFPSSKSGVPVISLLNFSEARHMLEYSSPLLSNYIWHQLELTSTYPTNYVILNTTVGLPTQIPEILMQIHPMLPIWCLASTDTKYQTHITQWHHCQKPKPNPIENCGLTNCQFQLKTNSSEPDAASRTGTHAVVVMNVIREKCNLKIEVPAPSPPSQQYPKRFDFLKFMANKHRILNGVREYLLQQSKIVLLLLCLNK